MKNNILRLATTIALGLTVSAPMANLQAATSINYDTAVELARAEAVNALLARIDDLNNRTKQYILYTGDITPTVAEINTYFNITDASAWENYNGNTLSVSLVNNAKIEVSNIFSSTPSSTVAGLYTEAVKTQLPPNSSIDSADISKADIILDATTYSFVKAVNNLLANPNVVVSSQVPADTTKIWYKPTGNGGFEILKYIDSDWKSYGTTNTNTDGGGSSGIVVGSIDELNAIPATTGMTAMVSDGTTAENYVYDGEQWVKTSTVGSGNDGFNGTGSIYAMATTLIKKEGGLVVTASAPSGEFAGSVDFTKKDDASSNGYWVSLDGKYIVTDKISTLQMLNNMFLTNATAWIDNGKGGVYKLEKRILPNGSTFWTYIATDYQDVLSRLNAPSDSGQGEYIYSTTHSEFFHKLPSANYIEPIAPATTYITSGNRQTFTTVSDGKRYLTVNNDCTSSTCNGEPSGGYYAGVMIDNLYSYYYSTSGKRENDLTDAKPYTVWGNFWRDAAPTVLWQGGNFGDIPNGVVLIKDTLNGDIVYKNTIGNFINKGNGRVIPQNKLPSTFTASSVSIAPYDGTNYVYVTNLDNFVIDANLGVGYPVILNGSGFNYEKMKKCAFYSNDALWSDNCSNIAGAIVAVTSGSRSDLPAPTNNLRLNLTKNLGGEARYTSNGIPYSKSTNYKQWFYSTSGTRTNNMLDAIPCNGHTGAADMDDTCYNVTPVFINANGLVDTPSNYFNNRTKYCYETYTMKSDKTYLGGYWWTSGSVYYRASKLYSSIHYENTYCNSGDLLVYYINGAEDDAEYFCAIPNTASCGTTGSDVWYK